LKQTNAQITNRFKTTKFLLINSYSIVLKHLSMKKSALLAAVCALFLGSSAVAQNQEVTYVEDTTQGYLLNDFKSNWFVTGEVGASVYMSPLDQHRALKDRFTPAAGIYVGKWFSPILGVRVGGNWLKSKGLADVDASGVYGKVNGYYKQKFNHFGPAADFMVNLTNWWCGYRPGRVYNATVYVGAGGFWTYTKDDNGDWSNDQDKILTVRAGLINSFQISKRVQLSLDLRWNGLDNHKDQAGDGWNKTASQVSAYLGVTYNFGKTTWNAPVVPVCPEAENCDALRARLASAEGRIADLENQLRDCLNRPVQKVEEKAPLATIYYPINSYKLTKKDVNVLEAVSSVMNSNTSKNYVLTGWADNYTGNDQINNRLRENRVNGVKNQLVKFGVNESQLTATTNNGNLCDLGEKYVALDRAVTIEEAE
jgi:outer membrane protein OmpA-like peptidoglycan-associated protein